LLDGALNQAPETGFLRVTLITSGLLEEALGYHHLAAATGIQGM